MVLSRIILPLVFACAATAGAAGAQGPIADADAAARAHELGVALFLPARNDADARAAAIESLEEAVALAPQERRYILDLADAYLRSGTDTGAVLAIDLYESVLQGDAQNDGLRARLAEAYAAIGGFETAMDHAAVRLSAAIPAPGAAGQAALVAMRGGRPGRAIALLEGLLRRSPKDNAVRLLLATLYDARGDSRRALEFADAVAVAETPDSPLAGEARRLGAEWRGGAGR